jgi:hypothetical protein
VSGAGVEHLLFVKRNGSYVLALWKETASWNPATKAPIPVAAQTVTIVLPSAPSAPGAVSLGDAGNLVAAHVAQTGRVLKVSVDDHVTFLSW